MVEKVLGIVTEHLSKDSKKYIGSPSIVILNSGEYIVSHDIYGPNSNEFINPITQIFKSSEGRTWNKISEIKGAF